MTESSIQVAVRIRPLNAREVANLEPVDTSQPFLGDGGFTGSPGKGGAGGRPANGGSGASSNAGGAPGTPQSRAQRHIRNIIAPVDDKVLVFDPAEAAPTVRSGAGAGPGGSPSRLFPSPGVGTRRPRDVRYAFDRVFPPETGQRAVFAETVEPMLDGVLAGYNASVFAYGATGCGKTHTISGTPHDPGLIFLTMQALYARIAEEHDEFETNVRLSYLEIYNEKIRDLLSATPTPAGPGLALREDAANKISVVGITEHIPASPEQVLHMITEGNRRRTQSATEANATSSRSHAVLQLNITRRPRTAGTVEEMNSASLNIIDLAGSERAAATNNQGMRMKEGANINRSLLALGGCINALCQSNGRKGRHIPYRNSKLTRLLKFSLGGNCKTVMIVCVSPSSAHYDETHNTLKYANQAKNIQTKVTRNLLNVDRHVAQYVQAIQSLRQEVQELKAKLAEHNVGESAAERRRRAERSELLAEELARLHTTADSLERQRLPAAADGAAAASLALPALRARIHDTEAPEHAVLRSFLHRCEAAADAAAAVPRGPLPTLPYAAVPPALEEDTTMAALFRATHAQRASELREREARVELEALRRDVERNLAAKAVDMLALAARSSSMLRDASEQLAYWHADPNTTRDELRPLVEEMRRTAVAGDAQLEAVAGTGMPGRTDGRPPLARRPRASLASSSPRRPRVSLTAASPRRRQRASAVPPTVRVAATPRASPRRRTARASLVTRRKSVKGAGPDFAAAPAAEAPEVPRPPRPSVRPAPPSPQRAGRAPPRNPPRASAPRSSAPRPGPRPSARPSSPQRPAVRPSSPQRPTSPQRRAPPPTSPARRSPHPKRNEPEPLPVQPTSLAAPRSSPLSVSGAFSPGSPTSPEGNSTVSLRQNRAAAPAAPAPPRRGGLFQRNFLARPSGEVDADTSGGDDPLDRSFSGDALLNSLAGFDRASRTDAGDSSSSDQRNTSTSDASDAPRTPASPGGSVGGSDAEKRETGQMDLPDSPAAWARRLQGDDRTDGGSPAARTGSVALPARFRVEPYAKADKPRISEG